ncbi:Tellurium resistance [Streptomyces sp. NPDC056600]|uniref:Tellurium resistance n=1 Tax=Streptomyces sp. NPDC056600 TaxID=3345874 RepID=UPI00368A1EAA
MASTEQRSGERGTRPGAAAFSGFSGFFDGLRPWHAAGFDTRGARGGPVRLTSRRRRVSLTKQGADTGNLRVQLAWRMRTSDLGGGVRESLLRHPLRALRPPEVVGHTQSMVRVDLDLGCLYELTDGSKGVVQPLGGLYGAINEPPYVKLDGDDRAGSGSGETMHINLDHRDDIRRLLVFAYIYDETPAFDRTEATVTLFAGADPVIEIDLDERHPQARSCAVFTVENVKGEIFVRREARYVYGYQAELDRLYGWGLNWGRGHKSAGR